MLLLVVGLIVLGVLGGVGYYFYFLPKTTQEKSTAVPSPTENVVVTKNVEIGESESPFGSISVKSDVITTEDCGAEECFAEFFASCSPATLSAESPLGSIFYEIYGPEDTGCKVLIKYTENPNPEWVNEGMTCVMDNSIGFLNSVLTTFEGIPAGSVVCEGPLYDVIFALGQMPQNP